MKILISLPDVRQIKNLVFSSFFNELKMCKNHQYHILVNKNYVHQLQQKINQEHIKFLPLQEPSKLQRKLFAVFYNIYEIGCFLSKHCPDQIIFYNRLKRFNKKAWRLRILGFFIGQWIPSKVKRLFFNICFEQKKYKALEVDRILLTTYHIIYDWQILASFKKRDVYFFVDGWDAVTKQTGYFIKPKKVFVWSNGMKASAIKNCNFKNHEVILSGNPFWGVLHEQSNATNKNLKLMAFDTNLNVYNINAVLSEIQRSNKKNKKFELSIRCSPVNSIEYQKKYEQFKSLVSEKNMYYTEDWANLNLNITQTTLIDTYNDQLNNHDIFIVFGPSTVILDILKLKKPVIILGIKGGDDTRWDWTETLNREVLDEFKGNPRVKVIQNLDVLEESVYEMTKHTNFDNVDDIDVNEKKLFQELIN